MRRFLFGLLCCLPFFAEAQEHRFSHCLAIAEAAPGLTYLHKASLPQIEEDYAVRLHLLGHASFLVQTQGGQTAVTDYSGHQGAGVFVPDIVTMNNIHRGHWTPNPDPAIAHVLQGWGETKGAGVQHYVNLGELVVRNVPTDIVSASLGRTENANSIFVFEAEGLCIGHLGHLHHEPDAQQYAALGRLDVAMVPVGDGYTLPQDDMVRMLERLNTKLILPMHWFNEAHLINFLSDLAGDFAIDRRDSSALEVSLRTLPEEPTIVVLTPDPLNEDS
ncbi:MBL fold metallo-hydrolase [Primorskyibacter sp. S187A]|uniref:MBL fold metallo-hydrolase n=1 Tax=Primorskyibacter sp. S187A TaxID=3415130 RepID=UPI003C7C0C20